MKAKTMYVADDGTPFKTAKECIEYEKSANEYIVYYNNNSIGQTFYNEALVKRYIANRLHDCYEKRETGNFKLVHHGKLVEFDSTELSEVVPLHYKINGKKFDEIFQWTTTKKIKIPGYTLHGDYYLADKVIPNKNWKEACEIKEVITLPNGKKVIAHTLSKEELETIPKEQRKIDENGHYWYWTSTPNNDNNACYVNTYGDFYNCHFNYSYSGGGTRLGFKNPFTN